MRQHIHRGSFLRTPAVLALASATTLAFLLILFLTAALGARERSWDIARLSAVFREAPVESSSWPNPYAGRNDAVRAGAKLFRVHCAECHGENGQGRTGAPALRTSVIQETPPGVLFWFLRNGNLRQGMPSWSGLPDQQRWQIVSFLKTLH